MSEYQCPLCGKDVSGGETFCTDCRQIAKNAFNTDLMSHHQSDESDENSETVPPPIADIQSSADIEQIATESDNRHKEDEDEDEEISEVEERRATGKSWLLIIGGIIACLLIGSVGCYFYLKTRYINQIEQMSWAQATKANTLDTYAAYLDEYPLGTYTNVARTKMTAIEEKETLDWDEVNQSEDVVSLYHFLLTYPNTTRKEIIESRIDSLIWMQVSTDDTAIGYKHYLNNVKLANLRGAFEPLAQERYRYLSNIDTIE